MNLRLWREGEALAWEAELLRRRMETEPDPEVAQMLEEVYLDQFKEAQDFLMQAKEAEPDP